MNSEKIYPLFLQKIQNQAKKQILKVFNKVSISDESEVFRVIVSFKDISNRDKFISKSKNLKILKCFDLIPSINLNLTKKQIHNLEKDKLIKKIEEDQKVYLSILDVREELGLNKYRKSQISYTGKNIIIGIVDNGINQDFKTISKVIINKFSITESTEKIIKKDEKREITHGTLLANVIANQFLDDKNNIIGIAPNVKIIDFDISNLKEEYYISNILKVFDFIIKNNLKVDILLLSFTTLYASDGKDILSLACDLMVDRGIIIICPAGNFGPESYTIGSPSAAKKVITIGAITKKKTISYFSGRGPTLDGRVKPNFCLPGSKIEVTLSNKIRVKISGTSVAASIGTGLVALLKEYNPEISQNEILEIIKKASTSLNYQKFSQGVGTPNFLDIFKKLGLYQEGIIVPYNDLIKKSLTFSIAFILILIIIYYLFSIIY